MYRVVFLRTNRIDPDPRVEKEVQSILEIPEVEVSAVAWDRGERYKIKNRILRFGTRDVQVVQFGLPASWGGGLKANFAPMVKFEWKLFWWLMFHHKEYDCIHACDLLTGLPAFIPSKLFRKKIVYDIFDLYAETQHGPKFLLDFFRFLEYRIINKSDVTIICSEKRIEQIKGSSPRKLIILHNAPSSKQLEVGAEEVALASGCDNKVKVVYVGNLVEDRFIRQTIEAVKLMSDQVEFHIGGYGTLEDYIKKEQEECKNVFFYGKMQYSEVISLEKQCDIMVAFYDPKVPNHAYAAPNKFYEALAIGKPLIMFRNTGMDGVITEHGLGAVCEPSVAGIQNAIKEVLNQRAVWGIIADKERSLFAEKYSWDIMEKRIQCLYKELGSNE